MLILDPFLAEQLVTMTPQRMRVLAARAFNQALGGVCESPYECCACGMPARQFDKLCELCGGENFKMFDDGVAAGGRDDQI